FGRERARELSRRCRRQTEQPRHAFASEDYVAAIGTAHHIKVGLIANGFGVAHLKLLATCELDQECTKWTTSPERPVRGGELILAHPAPSIFGKRMDRTDLNSKSTKPPSGPMKPAPPPLIASLG